MSARRSCWAVLVVLLVASLVLADEKDAATEKERAEHQARMKELAESFRVLANPRRADSVVKLSEKPVLRYADDTRQTIESWLWVLSRGGRPDAMLAIEYYPDIEGSPRWLYEIASLATRPIAAERGDDFRWVGKGPGIEFRRLDDAAAVADKPVRRLAQMKELRDRFTAYEKANIEGRIELRPLTAPLHRYVDAEQNVVDGAIFAFCSGTNPEVLLVLEAQKKEDGAAAWHYALVHLTGEAATAQLDGKQIWERSAAVPPAVRDGYVNGWIPAEKK
jgi:hypothetical protein